MRNWKVVIAGSALGLGAAFNAHALGLGDIEIHSGLNQPLDAEIQLLAVKPEEVSQIRVTLADQIAYSTSGIERVPLLSQLNFAVEQRGRGEVVIRVTTKDAVKEPFLDFIIEANWATGRLLREYTLLLDPPVFAGTKAAPAQQAATTEPKTKSISELIAGQEDEAAPKRQTKSISEMLAGESDVAAPRRTKNISDMLGAESGAGQVGPTGRADTLWSLAEQARADDAHSVEQVMMALFRNNPEAFFGDNINNLKAGIVLRTPDQRQIEELSKSQAARQAREHYQRWLAARRTAAATKIDTVGSESGLAAFADDTSPVAGGAKGGAPTLRLESPEEGAGGVSGGAGEGEEEIAAALAMRETENKELKDRIDALQEQLGTMERLITLKDDALVELQRKLGDTGEVVEIPVDAQPVEQPPVAEVVPEVAETPSEAVAQTEPVTAESEEAQHDESSWMDLLMDTTVLGILVGVLLLVGAVVWMVVRRRQQEEDFDASYPPLQDELKLPSGDAVQLGEESPSFGAVQTGFAAAGAAQAADDLADMGLETMDADETDIDPIAEADVYLAYRRFQQAEEIIKDALRHHPDRQDLQLKMLEIYYGASNKQGFEAQAEALYALLGGEDNDVWAKVSEMGHELCPDHPLFNPNAQAGGHQDFAGDLGDLGHEAATQAYDQGDHAFAATEENLFDDHAFNDQSFESGTASAAESNPFQSSASDEHAGEFRDARADQADSGVINFESGLGKGNQIGKRGDDRATVDRAEVPAEASHGLDFNFDVSKEMDFSHEEAPVASPDGKAGLGHDENDFLKGFDSNELDNFKFEAVNDEDQGFGQPSPKAKIKASGGNGGEIEEIFTGLEEAEFGEDTDELFSGTDMIGTKLDLARAYIDMDDREGARGILQEVLEEGDDTQKRQAKDLMAQIG